MENGGFQVKEISLHARPTALGEGGLVGWLETFVRDTMLRSLSDEEAKDVMEEVEEICKVDCRDSQGRWSLMYSRLRFVAVASG